MFSSATKKWRLVRSWTSKHPIWCAWQVTYRCNFRCRFCQYWHDPLGREPEPTPADYAAGAKKLASYGTSMISLAGGEPLLRHDVCEIVREIGRFHFPFLTTNGWFVTPDLASDLMKAGLWGVSISIDYADPARHNKARGVDGAWEQAWRAVEMLAAARVHKHQRINVISVLMDDNLDQLESVCQLAARRGAYYMVQPYGYLKTGSKAYEPQAAVAPTLLDIRRRNPNFLSNPYYLARFDEFFRGGVPDCRAGQAFFNIDSTGDIAICVERKTTPVANLYRDDIRTVHRRLRAASKNHSCTQCWYNCRGEVESLYRPSSLLASLPTFLLDHGAARKA